MSRTVQRGRMKSIFPMRQTPPAGGPNLRDDGEHEAPGSNAYPRAILCRLGPQESRDLKVRLLLSLSIVFGIDSLTNR